MKRATWYHKAVVAVFSVTLIMFLIFFFYMGTAERVSVYRAEQIRGYSVVTNVQEEQISDDTAPIGIRRVYRCVLEPEQVKGSSFLFQISHHDVEVYFDDQLVYSLTGAEGNVIGANVFSNWCVLYAGQERTGQTVTVILTPLFEAAMEKQPQFLFGSIYSVARDVFINELPLMVLASLCILLGLFIFAVFLYFRYIVKTAVNGMSYLGLFSLFMGLWKLTDMRSMSLLFPQHTMALGYVSVGSLFLVPVCLLMYCSTLFMKERRKGMLFLTGGSSLVACFALAMQLLGVTEIRQNLIFSHILLIVSALSVPLGALYNRIVHKNWGLRRSWKLLLLLAVGIAVDLLLYYLNNGNSPMSFSILGFIISTLVIFLNTVQEATRKAYTDTRTGLVNRARWNGLMNNTVSFPEPYALMMIDLNGLKQINDALGHEAGDRLIFHFSTILRENLPRSSVICRWGGDEFAVLLTGTSREQLDRQVERLFTATEYYNTENPLLPIYFALGAALSSEHPGISRSELFRLADEEMYRNKQLWYARQ